MTMATTENNRTPRFEMWVIAAAAGLVAAGVAVVIGGFSLTQAGFVGLLLAVAIIVAFGLAGPDRTVVPAAEADHAPAVAAPIAAPLMAAAGPVAAARPAAVSGARDGKADDLKIVKGIGPKLEELCHTLGFYHFDQVANWTAGEVAWVDENLEGFKGRVTRDRWVTQAQAIVALGPDEFLRQLDAGKEF